MNKRYAILSALLRYPDATLRADLPDILAAIPKAEFSRQATARLARLARRLGVGDPLDREEAYVRLFDRGRGTSLHLFEHVHGDSRDRGPAMIDLAQTFEAAGLYLAEGEMPDHLPVVLEYASTQPAREARAFLAEMSHILEAIFSALSQRNSRYAAVLGALIELSGGTALPAPVPEDEPIDEVWAEPPAFDGCSSKGQAPPGEAQTVHVVRRDRGTTGARP